MKLNRMIFTGLKNASYLTMGTIIGMVINFIGFIFITRELGPTDYGIFATVTTYVSFFALITMSQMAKVLIRRSVRDIDKMKKVYEKTIGVKKALALAAMLLCLISTFIMPYTSETKLYIGIFSFNLIYLTFNQYFVAIFQAVEKMQYQAFIQIMNRVIYVVFGITFLYLGFGLPAIIIISLAANLISLGMNVKLSQRFVKIDYSKGFYWDKKIMRATIIFSIIMFISFFSTKIDILMISWLMEESDVGIYSVAVRLIEPVSQLKNIVSIAFFPIFVKFFSGKSIDKNQIFKYSIALGIVVFAGAAVASFLAKPIVPILFGEEFSRSGSIFSVLIFYSGFSFMNFPFMSSLQAANYERLLLKIVWIPAVSNVILNLVFLHFFGLIGIAYSTLCVTAINYFVHMMLTRRLIKRGKI
ncbi:MAG: flippase [Thermoplasmatota archaeon]